MHRTLGVVVALLSVTGAGAQVQSPTDVDVGRIAGHVITAYAELVGDATVTLWRINDQGVNDQEVRLQSLTTKTDGSGAFAFTQLAEGRYRVVASKPGYTSRELPAQDLRLTFDVGPAVDLATDAQVSDVQVVLRRTASISGRIFRPDGSAAANVQVEAAFRSARGRQPLFETRATSQGDGRYEITGLPPGEYLVGALNVPMPTPQRFEAVETGQAARNAAVAAVGVAHTTWYPGVPDSEPGAAVTILEGINAEGADIWLTPSQRFFVSGRVFWPIGVTIESLTIDYGDPAGTSSGVSLVADPGGLFSLTRIAPGALTMLARAESDQGALIGMASTEVSVDAVEDVRIVVDRPGLIAGRVVYEGKAPPTARAAFIVAVQKLLKVSALYPVPQSAVDSSGRFELTGTVGEYELALEGLGPGLAVKRVTRNGRTLPMNRIGVAPGEAIRDVEIVVGQ
jgi:hypothetical protein